MKYKPTHRPSRASLYTLAGVGGERGGRSFSAMAITHEVRLTDAGGSILRISLTDQGTLIISINCDLPGSVATEFHMEPEDLQTFLGAIRYIAHD